MQNLIKRHFKKFSALIVFCIMSCNHVPLNKDIPYHVLVLKFCSVNTDYLSFFSKHPESIISLPNFEKTFKQSYLFLNAYSDLTWSNQVRFLYGRDEKYEKELQEKINKKYKELEEQKPALLEKMKESQQQQKQNTQE